MVAGRSQCGHETGGTRLSRPFTPMVEIPVSREAGGTRLSRPFSPMAQIPVSREAGGTRLSRPFTPIGTDPRFVGGGRDALVASVHSNWHRSPFRGRREGARWTRAASARGGGAKIREGSFSTFGNQSRRDAENAEEPGAPSRGKPVDVPSRSKLRPSRRRGTM